MLLRPQHRYFTDRRTYIEIDIDFNEFGIIARKSWYAIKDIQRQVKWDFALTVEGHTDDELPERIICSACLRSQCRGPEDAIDEQHALEISEKGRRAEAKHAEAVAPTS